MQKYYSVRVLTRGKWVNVGKVVVPPEFDDIGKIMMRRCRSSGISYGSQPVVFIPAHAIDRIEATQVK